MVMDNSKRNPASTAYSKNPDFKESCSMMGGFWERVNKETNENEALLPNSGRLAFAKVLLSSPPLPKKKILAERNVVVDDDAPPPPPFLAMETTTTPTPKVQGIKVLSSPAGPPPPPPCRRSSSSSAAAAAAAYDPVTNFTSPRPEFLRYNPNRRREILQRMEVGDMKKDFECGGSSSTSSSEDQDAGNEEELASLIESNSASPPKSTSQEGKEEEEEEEEEEDTKQGGVLEKDDSDYEEVEERTWSRSRMVLKLLFIFGLFFISCHYLFPTTTTSSITPFHQDQEENEEITIPHRPTYCLSRSDHLLTTHMGVSDLCLSAAGEMMCPIDGHTCSSSSSSLAVDDEEEIHIIIGSRPTIREEGFDDDLVMSDEVVTGMVHSQVEVVERDDDSSHAQLGADTTLVAMEERVQLSTSHVLFEQEDDDGQREECENVEETLGDDEAIERNNDIHLKSEKVQQASLEAPSCPLRSSEDTELVEKSMHLTETPHSTAARNAPQVVQASEESKFSIISQSAFRWNHLVYFSREVPFIFIWISLLAAALVGFLSFLFKYFVKPSSRNTLLPCSKSSIDEKKTDASMVEEMRNIEEKGIKPAVVEEESRDIDQDSRVNNLSLDRLREKYGESSSSYARRQPTLQLLGEFSLAESEIGGGQTFKRIEPEREEGPRTCQYKTRSPTLRKSPSSSSNKLHPPPSTESTLEGSYRPGKKLRKTEDSSNKSEEKMVATPLRRSDRLRKRVTSP